MKCSKCNHILPNDSEFCQYCGSKIETIAVAETVEEELSDVENMSGEKALKFIMATQVKATKEAYDANSQSQPNNESDDNFGLIPEKPIYTLARKSVDGEIEYLSKLRTPDGQKVKWNRRGSISVDGVHGLIDIYDIYRLSGQKYCTIYINMYGAKTSTKMPKGFGVQKSQPDKKVSSTSKSVSEKFWKLDLISIFVLIVPIILSIVGLNSSYSYYRYSPEGLYGLVIGSATAGILLKILTVAKFKNNLVVTILSNCCMFLMLIPNFAEDFWGADEVIASFTLIATLLVWAFDIWKLVKISANKYHATQSYKMKCYKKINLLNEYLQKGIISQEEFDNTRKQIVSKIR